MRVVSAAALSFASLLVAALLPAQTLRIGSWNLEQYGFRKDPPRTEQHAQAIADYIGRLGVAVLAVQEVGGEEPLADLCGRMGPDWRFVLGTTGGFNGEPGRISVGFLWDERRVELVQAGELLDFPRELEGQPIFHRVPVTACFRVRRTTSRPVGAPAGDPGDLSSATDFRLVTVHLKAGQKEADFQKRRLEVATLRDWLARLVEQPNEDPDVIVLGDFNHSYDAEVKDLFERGGLVAYLRSGKPVDPTIAHFDAPIDMIAVARGFAEVQPATFDVHNEDGLKDKQRWMDLYSDHFPVTVELKVGADDDPQATFGRERHALRARSGVPVRGGGARGGAGAGAGGAEAAGGGAPVAAAAVAPAAAGAQDPAPRAEEEPVRVGMRVQVVTLNGQKYEGQLLRPLGDWVFLRQNDGRNVGLYARNVVSVAQL